jgi:predicted transcriptional regulator
MKTIRDLLHGAPVWVNPEHTTESAIYLMRGHDLGALPVLEGARMVGFLTYREALGADPRLRVCELMRAEVPSISPDASVREAADLMAHTRLDWLPVLEEGKLRGVVSALDLLLPEEKEEEASAPEPPPEEPSSNGENGTLELPPVDRSDWVAPPVRKELARRVSPRRRAT